MNKTQYSSVGKPLLSRRLLPNLHPSYPLPSFWRLNLISFFYTKLQVRSPKHPNDVLIKPAYTDIKEIYGFIWKGEARNRSVPLRLPYNVYVQFKMAALRGRVVTECLTTCMFRQTSTASISTLPIVMTRNKVSGVFIFISLLHKTRESVVVHVTWLWQKLNSIAEVVQPVFVFLNLTFKTL